MIRDVKEIIKSGIVSMIDNWYCNHDRVTTNKLLNKDILLLPDFFS